MKSVKTRIIIRMVTLVTAALVMVGVTSTILNINSTTELLSSNMKNLAEVAGERVAWEIDSYVGVARESGMNKEYSDTSISAEKRVEALNSNVQAIGLTRGVILDENGVNIITGVDMSDRKYVQDAFAGKARVSEPLVSRVTGEISIIVGAPLWKDGTKNTTVVGCVYVVPEENFMNDIMNAIHVSDSCHAYMIDSNGVTIADTTMDTVAAQQNIGVLAQTDPNYKEIAAIHQKMQAGESGFTTLHEEGKLKAVCYAPVPDTDGWSICITSDMDDFLVGTYRSVIIIIAITIAGIAIAIVIATILGKKIGEPIHGFAKRLKQLSEGDLTSPVPTVKSNDELAVLSSASNALIGGISTMIHDIDHILEEMARGNFSVDTTKNANAYVGDFAGLLRSVTDINQRLSGTLSQINNAADQVSSGSDQVSAGAQALSEGATQQASSIQELAATINEISSHISRTSDNCEVAQQTTNSSTEAMQSVMNQMQRLIEAMEKIDRSSDEIGKIIKTIEDIAFQTNILALNAAVEAARAGEAGKGFAVVADEVRNLASKSAEAASNTTVLIQESIAAVQNGNKIVQETAQQMNVVAEGSLKVNELINQIVDATREQANSAGQVTVGINQISSVVQTNSATAEESAAASEELSSQSAMLKDLIGSFTLKD